MKQKHIPNERATYKPLRWKPLRLKSNELMKKNAANSAYTTSAANQAGPAEACVKATSTVA